LTILKVGVATSKALTILFLIHGVS
jgi:hypothetical protein